MTGTMRRYDFSITVHQYRSRYMPCFRVQHPCACEDTFHKRRHLVPWRVDASRSALGRSILSLIQPQLRDCHQPGHTCYELLLPRSSCELVRWIHGPRWNKSLISRYFCLSPAFRCQVLEEMLLRKETRTSASGMVSRKASADPASCLTGRQSRAFCKDQQPRTESQTHTHI